MIVACFASHVHRVQQVMDAAVRTAARSPTSAGRWCATWQSPGISATSTCPADTLIDMRDLDNYPPEQVVLVSTGSQGEPMSALSRMANRDHQVVQIEPGDTVVLASSLIPGNENSVFRVINGLTRHGANVVHKGNALVHVSGHASAGELLYCYNIVKPRNVMPVHGEIRHLLANAELAVATGVPRERRRGRGRRGGRPGRRRPVVGKVDCGYVFVDGSTVGDITETSLKDRRILGDEGFISVIAVMDLHRQIDSRTGDPRPRVRRGRHRLRRRGAEDRGGDREGDRTRGGRHAPAAAGHPPHGRPVGERHPPAPADDHPGRHRDLSKKKTAGVAGPVLG